MSDRHSMVFGVLMLAFGSNVTTSEGEIVGNYNASFGVCTTLPRSYYPTPVSSAGVASI